MSTSKAPTPLLQHTAEKPAAPYTDDPVHTIYFGDNLDILRRYAPDGTLVNAIADSKEFVLAGALEDAAALG